MALSGTINGSVSRNADKISYYINWSATQSVSGNYSDVTISVYWGRLKVWNFDTVGVRNYWAEINGDRSSGSKRFDLDPWTEIPYCIQTKTTRVYHNSDGTKSLNISSYTDGTASTYGADGCNTSATITLDTILREATITSTVDFTIGNNIPLTTNNPGGFNLKFHLYIDNQFICEKTGSGISTLLTFTTAELNTMYSKTPNNNNKAMSIACGTFSGTTQIGDWKWKAGTCYVINSNPTLSDFTYLDTSIAVNVTGSNQKLLQNKSTIQITAGAITFKNYATFSKYSAQIGSRVYESTSNIINIGTTVGEENIILKVIDSRGNFATVTKTIRYSGGNIELIPYDNPIINTYIANRISSGTSVTVSVNATGKVAKKIRDNSQYVTKTRYKEFPSGAWSSYSNVAKTIDINGNITIATNIGSFDINKSFIVELAIDDYFTTTKQEYTVPSAKMLLSMRKDMIGINMIPEAGKGALQINGGISIDGNSAGSPTGMIQICAHGYATIPDGWLVLEGQAVSRTTYSKLYGLVSTLFGAGDGSTTFNVPDFRGRVPVGYNGSDSNFNAVGKKVGSSTHTLSLNEMPVHSHGIHGVGDHQHSVSMQPFSYAERNIAGSDSIRPSENTACQLKWNITTGSGAHSHGMNNAGSGWAHNNLQPSIAMLCIIKY